MKLQGDRIVTLKRGEDTHPEPGTLTLQEIKIILSGVPGTLLASELGKNMPVRARYRKNKPVRTNSEQVSQSERDE